MPKGRACSRAEGSSAPGQYRFDEIDRSSFSVPGPNHRREAGSQEILSAGQGAAKLLDVSYLPAPQRSSFQDTLATLRASCSRYLAEGIAPALSSQFEAADHIPLPRPKTASATSSVLLPQVRTPSRAVCSFSQGSSRQGPAQTASGEAPNARQNWTPSNAIGAMLCSLLEKRSVTSTQVHWVQNSASS